MIDDDGVPPFVCVFDHWP